MKPAASALTPERQENEAEAGIRPQTLGDFTGQRHVTDNLAVFISAAKKREEPLDHCLLYGPPGWARRRWRRSSPARWASASARPPARC